MDSFYQEIVGGDFKIREVTKGAFTQARAKLGHEVLDKMNRSVNDTFYTEAPYLVWNDMRLVACDGSRAVLPRHQTVVEEFGEHGFGPKADGMRSLATMSFLYDTLNLLVMDAQIASYSTSERELLDKHLNVLGVGDLLLLD